MKQQFKMGRIVATANALETLDGKSIELALCRHRNCDWGESLDKEMNDSAVKNGEDRIISVYHDSNGIKFWIITEADRSATTVLLPEDY